MKTTLRPGRPEDAFTCGTICYHAFKHIADFHHFPADFPSPQVAADLMSMMLAKENVYSVVAEVDGKVVGSNFLWENCSIAGVGPITIDPAVQNGKIGRALMDDVLYRARQRAFSGVRLVQASYHGRSLSLYTKLGFESREPLATMQGPALNLKISGYRVRAARPKDLEACNDICISVHGHQRGPELLDAIHQGTAKVVLREGHITGYSTLIGFFGHAVGETNGDLKALIAAAESFPGPGFLLPIRNGELFRWCLKQGLRVVQPMTLMTTGLYNQPAGAFLPSVLY